MKQRHRTAFSMIYVCVMTFMLAAILSLAVDFGRAQLAKTQLQAAVDAAARYAASGITDSTYLTKAQTSASENTVDTTGLALLSSDVTLGTWDGVAKTFTAGGSTPNAIKIVGYRKASRGTAVPLTFGQVVGRPTLDMQATAIATATPAAPSYNIVGTNGVTLSGSGQIKRWASEAGTVNVACNSSINVPWGTYIYGDAFHRTTAPTEPGNGITGTNTQMSTDLSYALPTVPGGAMAVGAINITSPYSCPGGNYSCTSLTIGGGAAVTFTGDTNIYCSGAVTIGNGCTINTSTNTYKVTLYLTATSTVDLNMSSTFYMMIYGPNATLNLTGSSPMIGSVIVKNLNVSGGATLSYSSALTLSQAGSGGGSSTATFATVQ